MKVWLRAWALAICASTSAAAGAAGWSSLWPWPIVIVGTELITSSGHVYIGGIDAQIVRSDDDGVTWSHVGILQQGQIIDEFATDGSTAVAIGPAGIFLTSVAGGPWVARPLPDGIVRFSTIGHGADWLAIAQEGFVYRSTNGITWTYTGVNLGGPPNCNLNFGNGRWVCVGPAGLFSSVDGLSWTTHTTDGEFRDAVYGGSGWVAVGFMRFATSVDGINWTMPAAPANPGAFLGEVIWGGGRYVAVGSSAGAAKPGVMYSTDGVTWNYGVSPADEFVSTGQGVTWTGTRYIASHGFGSVIASNDGINWTTLAKGSDGGLQRAARNGSKYVAVGQLNSFARLVTSADGVHWTDRSSNTLGVPEDFSDVVAHGAGFVALKRDSVKVASSSDGASWSFVDAEVPLPLGPGVILKTLGGNGSQLVVAGLKNEVYTSADGVVWVRTRTGPHVGFEYVRDILWTGTQWVMVGEFPAVITSPDGVTWTETPISVPSWTGHLSPMFDSIAFGNGRYVAVTNRGGVSALFQSTDLVNWSGIAPMWSLLGEACTTTVTWTGLGFIAVGGTGVCTSADGVTWLFSSNGRSQTFREVIAGGSGVIAFGEGIFTRVDQPNRARVAMADSFNATAGVALVGDLSGSDADLDPLWFSVTSPPLHGSVQMLDPNSGSFRYVSNGSGALTDSFSFTVSDGNLTSTAAVATIAVAAAPDPGSGGGSGGAGGGGSVDLAFLALIGTLRALLRRSVALGD